MATKAGDGAGEAGLDAYFNNLGTAHMTPLVDQAKCVLRIREQDSKKTKQLLKERSIDRSERLKIPKGCLVPIIIGPATLIASTVHHGNHGTPIDEARVYVFVPQINRTVQAF